MCFELLSLLVAAAGYAATKDKDIGGKDIAVPLVATERPDVLLVGALFGMFGYVVQLGVAKIPWFGEVALDFIEKTGVDVFAPANGNAQDQYKKAPKLNHQRVTDLVEATGVPMALHGGTGLSEDQFRDLISRGCAKVNISTAIKEAFMRSGLEHLKEAEAKNKWDPPTLFNHQKAAVAEAARRHISLFGGSGRAW